MRVVMRVTAAAVRARRGGRWVAGLTVIGAAVFAIATVSSCRDDDGCGVEQSPPLGALDDTPRPSLCPSDSFLLTPSRLTFAVGATSDATSADASASPSNTKVDEVDDIGDGGDAGEAGEQEAGSKIVTDDAGGGSATSQTNAIEMAVEGRRDTGQPRATATVFITASSDDDFVELSPGPNAGSDGAAKPGQCERVSVVRLRCILDGSGVARFTARAARAPANGQRGVITAVSGARSTTASVQAGTSFQVFDTLGIKAASPELARAPGALECGPAPREEVPCTTFVARDVTIDIYDVSGSPRPPRLRDAGDGDGDAGERGADAGSLLPAALTAPVDVTLSVSVAGAAGAWLTTNASCSQDNERSITVRINPLTNGHDRVRLCSDGAPGTARLFARAQSLRGVVVASAEAVLPAMPATVKITPQSDGGAAASHVLSVADCTGAPIGGAAITLDGTPAANPTASDGTVVVAAPPSDAGASSSKLEAQNPSVGGEAAQCQVTLSAVAP